MSNRNVIVAQWKQMSQSWSYLSKFVTDKTVENALSHEITQFLQKIQPSVSSIYFWKYLNSNKVESLPKNPEPTSVVKTAPKEMKRVVVPKWKETQIEVNRDFVVAQTHHILTLLANASSIQSILNRIEALNVQINTYFAAKHIAEKGNAVRLLLRIKRQTHNEEVHSAVNETLAVLGYPGPVKGRGVKILSIDGGGIRGILVLKMLKKLEQLTGKKIQDMFDLICGVSTGAIIASLITLQKHTLDEIIQVYKTLSTQVFSQSTFRGTSSLVWSRSYYDTALWEKLLQEHIGDVTLQSTSRKNKAPKLCMVSAMIQRENTLLAYVFRNYSFSSQVQARFEGSHKHMIWEAVRASAAAPMYFEEFKLGNMLLQDGAIVFNNPTPVALHEARLLWPETPIQCVLSFGTGRTIPHALDADNVEDAKSIAQTSWRSQVYALIESATDTEGTHTMLTDLLPDKVYYRFNPYVTEKLDIAEIDPEKLGQLERDAIMYLRTNEDKFQEAAKVLTAEKRLTDKVMDWLRLQKEIYGLKFAR